LACGRDENQLPGALLAKTENQRESEIGWPATWTVDAVLCVKNSFITESFFKLIYWPARRLAGYLGFSGHFANEKLSVFAYRLGQEESTVNGDR